MTWHHGPMATFDTETDGLNVEEVHIVTACVAVVPARHPDGGPRTPAISSWLADPGVEIPKEATAVHGITTEYAREHGAPLAEVVDCVVEELRRALDDGIPIVGANLQYDLTIINRECERLGLEPLEHRVRSGRVTPVIDVMVIDRAIDPYRKGGRKLTDLTEYYGVKLEGAHDSTADALGAGRVAWKLASLGPRKPDGTPLTDSINGRGRVIDVSTMTLDYLHEAQVRWKAAQAKSLAAYFAGKGQDVSGIRGEWPFIPAPEQDAFF